MTSRWLRRCLAAIAILLILEGMALVRIGGLTASVAAALAVASFLAIWLGIFTALYAASRRYGWKRPDALKISPWRAARGAIADYFASIAAFILIQPFEQWWLGNDAAGRPAPGRLPVLLVHGYFCNRGIWWWLRRRLRRHGIAVATVDLEPPLAGIDHLAEKLHIRIETLLAETGADRVVLAGHSMGGLVARAYLRRHGARRVAKVVTLATPHHGSFVAYLGLGRNAREMRPDSEWLRKLALSEPMPIPVVNIWSAGDSFVVPQDSSRLAGARETVLPDTGHLAMVFSPAVLDILIAELAISEATAE